MESMEKKVLQEKAKLHSTFRNEVKEEKAKIES